MASGVITMFDPGKEFIGKLEWATYTNTASNSSTIVITGSMIKMPSAGLNTAVGTWYWDLLIANEDFSEVLGRDRMTEKYAEVGITDFTEIFTFTETIPHKADGSRKINISCDIWIEDDLRIDDEDWEGEWWRGASTSYIGSIDADDNYIVYENPNGGDYLVSLDSIIRKATMKTAPNIDDKTTSIKVEYSNPMGSYVSSVAVCIADSTGNNIIVPYRTVNPTGTSYTFNLSSTERQALVNAMGAGSTMGIRYYIRTIAYETYHYDFISKTYTMSDAMPTISATIADMNETTKALTGDYNTLIRYMSDAAVSINAVAKNGATIVRCDCQCGSYNEYNTNGIFRVVGAETGIFTVSATDSRGNKVSQQIQKTMMLYEKVSCNLDVKMELVGSTGAKATMYIRGNYYNGRFGTTSAAASNSITLQYRYAVDSGSPGDWITINVPTSALSDNKYNLTHTISNLNYQSQYKFQCRVFDKLTEALTDTRTVILQPVFDWSGSDFQFNVPVKFNAPNNGEDGFLNDFIVDYGTEKMGTNGTWYWFKYKSGRSECYGLRNFGNMGVSTALGALYRSAAFTQDLPQDVFLTNSVPDYISINVVANGTGWICRDGSGASPAYYNTGSFYVVSPTSGTQSAVWLSFHVMGRWK